ncbi:MAG: DnaB-like helicase C-terminal domain-containing protein [Nocardioides sp.]|uniref:replicative DNA helicase n=1 Tax=Nocardioides sp. TaxID=35761 RepID=UPI0039E33FCD
MIDEPPIDPDDEPTPGSQMADVRDAEISLLGAVMSGYDDLDGLAEQVTGADFYRPEHEETWDAVMRVHRGGVKPDPVSVRLALDKGSRVDPLSLLHMTQMVPLVSQAPYYADRVATASGLRRIQAAGLRIQQLGNATGGDLDDIRERARAEVDAATTGRVVSRARTVADLLPDVLDIAEHGQANVLGTGWPDVDDSIGGLGPGRLVVVGARPGVGKSLMGTNLALHMAHHHGHAVLLASLEMPEREVGQRMLAAFAQANLTDLQTGRTDERTWERIGRHAQALMDLPITIDDSPDQTVTSIRRAARNVQRKRDDLALIVVDYLQLVRPVDNRPNRAEQLGEVSRGLKLLARETGACVVAMAQVNRESTKRTDGRPMLADLRESGSIEADADQVLLLHHPDDELPDLEVITAKNRHGPKATRHLYMQGHYARLTSTTWAPREDA